MSPRYDHVLLVRHPTRQITLVEVQAADLVAYSHGHGRSWQIAKDRHGETATSAELARKLGLA